MGGCIPNAGVHKATGQREGYRVESMDGQRSAMGHDLLCNVAFIVFLVRVS